MDDASGASATVLVDRILYRAARVDGVWVVRASFLLRQVADPGLDVELPASPSALGPGGADGRQVDWQASAAAVPGGPVKHLARLRPGRRPIPTAGRARRGLPDEAGTDRDHGGPGNLAAAAAGRRPRPGADAPE